MLKNYKSFSLLEFYNNDLSSNEVLDFIDIVKKNNPDDNNTLIKYRSIIKNKGLEAAKEKYFSEHEKTEEPNVINDISLDKIYSKIEKIEDLIDDFGLLKIYRKFGLHDLKNFTKFKKYENIFSTEIKNKKDFIKKYKIDSAIKEYIPLENLKIYLSKENSEYNASEIKADQNFIDIKSFVSNSFFSPFHNKDNSLVKFTIKFNFDDSATHYGLNYDKIKKIEFLNKLNINEIDISQLNKLINSFINIVKGLNTNNKNKENKSKY
jgi:hypothetical protein